MIGFTKALARESARYGVRCNAVAPGPIETPLLNAAPPRLGEIGERLKQGMIDATAMGRSGEPEEVAAAIAFLAADDASYVTGQTSTSPAGCRCGERAGGAREEFVVEGRLLTDVGGTSADTAVLSTPA